MDRPKRIQFSVSQLFWGIALISAWLYFVHLSLTIDIRQPPEPDWGITVAATPPLAGGLLGLIQNKVKGMLVGIGIGTALLVPLGLLASVL